MNLRVLHWSPQVDGELVCECMYVHGPSAEMQPCSARIPRKASNFTSRQRFLSHVHCEVGACFALHAAANASTWRKVFAHRSASSLIRPHMHAPTTLQLTCSMVESAFLSSTLWGFWPGNGVWPGRQPDESQKSPRAAGAVYSLPNWMQASGIHAQTCKAQTSSHKHLKGT